MENSLEKMKFVQSKIIPVLSHSVVNEKSFLLITENESDQVLLLGSINNIDALNFWLTLTKAVILKGCCKPVLRANFEKLITEVEPENQK